MAQVAGNRSFLDSLKVAKSGVYPVYLTTF
jgi:hypothetical protein